MKLSDIKPGMEIKYRGRVYGHGNLMGKQKTRRGTVTQVTPNLIAVQGQRYPDTVLVNDLLSGQVKIISLKEEEHMSNPVGKPKREPPAKEKLQQAFEKHEGKIKPIATEFKTGWAQARNWLIEAGIIDSDYVYQKQTSTLEPDQAANQEPDEGEGESATEIIPEPYRKCEDCGKGLTREEVREFNPAGYVNEETKILCSWCYSNYLNRQIPPEPVKMPIGCSLPLEDSTEPQDDEMAESDTGPKSGIAIQLLLDAEETAKHQMLNMSPTEKELLENTLNAYFLVKRVLNDPVALALMKQVLESGVV